jgi:hypothetical protein
LEGRRFWLRRLAQIIDLWYYDRRGVFIMKLDEAKALYPGEWIAFRTIEEGDNPEGEVT